MSHFQLQFKFQTAWGLWLCLLTLLCLCLEIVFLFFWGRFFWWWTRARESRSRKIGGAVIGQLSEMIVNTSALYWNYFTLCRRFFPAANRVAWAAWTWSGQGQEIPLRFCWTHIRNLHIPRITMMYNMSLFFLFQFFDPYNLGWKITS